MKEASALLEILLALSYSYPVSSSHSTAVPTMATRLRFHDCFMVFSKGPVICFYKMKNRDDVIFFFFSLCIATQQ